MDSNESKEKKIKVVFTDLTKPLESMCVKQGSTLADFCKDNNITLDDSVRVNSKRVDPEYQIKENDIITKTPKVAGGN